MYQVKALLKEPNHEQFDACKTRVQELVKKEQEGFMKVEDA